MHIRKIILGSAATYLVLGFLFYSSFHLLSEMKTYECKNSSAPHGYITIFNNSFNPPSGMDCSRRAWRAQELITAPVLTILWLPLIIMKFLFGR